MFARNEFANRLAARGAEAHQHSEWTIKKMAGVRSLARPVQSRVATVTLDMAEQYLDNSIWVSHVAVPRKDLGLEERIELSAHVLVAGAQGGLRQMHQVPAGLRQEVPAFLAAHGAHTVASEKYPLSSRCSLVHLTLIRRRHPRKWSEDCWARIFSLFREYELQRRKGMQESQNEKEEMRQQQVIKIMTDMRRMIKSKGRMDAKNSWWSAFETGQEAETRALHPRLGAVSVHVGHGIFKQRGVTVCVKCGGYSTWVNRELRRDCPGHPSELGMEVLKRMANRETPRTGQE